MNLRILTLTVLVAPGLLAVGCAALVPHNTAPADLTPAEQRGWERLHAFVETASHAYHRRPPLIDLGPNAATYSQGVIRFPCSYLNRQYTYPIMAHEVAHYLLNHREFGPTEESEANVEGVKVLAAGLGIPEDEAAARMLGYLYFLRNSGRAKTEGYRPICQQIADVLAAYPDDMQVRC